MAYEKKVYKKPDERRARYTGLNLTNVNEEKKSRLLFWSSLNGNPRINVYLDNEVYTNNKPDWNKIIIASFLPLDLKVFIKKCRIKLKEDKNDYCETVCYYPKFVNGVKTEERMVRGIARFGKDKNDVWYLYIEEPEKGKIKFDILPDNWHAFRSSRDATSDDSKESLSFDYGEAYIDLLEHLFKADIADALIKVEHITTREGGNIIKPVTNTGSVTEVKESTDLDSLF